MGGGGGSGGGSWDWEISAADQGGLGGISMRQGREGVAVAVAIAAAAVDAVWVGRGEGWRGGLVCSVAGLGGEG